MEKRTLFWYYMEIYDKKINILVYSSLLTSLRPEFEDNFMGLTLFLDHIILRKIQIVQC